MGSNRRARSKSPAPRRSPRLRSLSTLIEEFLDGAEECNVKAMSKTINEASRSNCASSVLKGQRGDQGTALHIAVRGGSIDTVNWILGRPGSSANVVDSAGDSPLAIACRLAYVEIVRLLLKKGRANPNHRDGNGSTPLHVVSCLEGESYSRICVILVIHGANPFLQDNSGNTPLHLAVTMAPSIVRTLLDLNPYGDLMGESATQKQVDDLASNWDVSKMIGSWSNLSTEYSIFSSATPLHMACYRGDLEMVKILLGPNSWGALFEGDEKLFPVLLDATESGNVELVRYLLKRKDAFIDTTEEDGMSSLHIAAGKGDLEMVKLLLKCGANKQCKDYLGKTPQDWAAETGQEEIVAILDLGSDQVNHANTEYSSSGDHHEVREQRQDQDLSGSGIEYWEGFWRCTIV